MKSFISQLKKNNIRGLFITAPDTNAGKTTIALRILHHLKHNHFRTTALKPIASGCEQTHRGLRNDDALKLQRACSMKMDYHHINPIAFNLSVAPHLAAAKDGISLSAQEVYRACLPALKYQSDIIITEGAGGLMCPLNNTETTLDLIKLLGFPILLVIPIRLGCLNQTLMLYEIIKHHNINLFGWVANHMDIHMALQDENIEWLQEVINEPLLFTRSWKL
ncbi:MAG: dethiobiotin synthase [Gammaproteobacteria bacterium]|nr:dethiobiotin synthase [Gammaproteobacteria bacterium]MCH9743569.1 dethiobiotin synthase [Gammaproteobacteria bacterium]